MPTRNAKGDYVYHVLNRANGKMKLFNKESDYVAFEAVLEKAHERVPMRTIAYCIMPNHWHFLLWPYKDGDLSSFMYWLTMTHTQRWHAAHGTTGFGHIYQGRFKSIPVQSDEHYFIVHRYIEANALRSGLVKKAQQWQWSSLWRNTFGDAQQKKLLSNGPIELPDNWKTIVNGIQPSKEIEEIRGSIKRNRPFGEEKWVMRTARRLSLEFTLKPRGRPRLKP